MLVPPVGVGFYHGRTIATPGSFDRIAGGKIDSLGIIAIDLRPDDTVGRGAGHQ